MLSYSIGSTRHQSNQFLFSKRRLFWFVRNSRKPHIFKVNRRFINGDGEYLVQHVPLNPCFYAPIAPIAIPLNPCFTAAVDNSNMFCDTDNQRKNASYDFTYNHSVRVASCVGILWNEEISGKSNNWVQALARKVNKISH